MILSSEQTSTLAGLIASDALSNGQLAILRRLDPTQTLPPEVWRLIGEIKLPGEAAERAVAGLLGLMAQARIAGTPQPIGRALAAEPGEKTAYAEARFVRLLRARGLSTVMHEARQVVKWCVTHGRVVRFTGYHGFAEFILAAATEAGDAETIGHTIARDYFRRPAATQA